jgi:hypothetical protein
MKTRLTSPIAFMIVSVCISMASCTKEPLTDNPVINVPTTPGSSIQSATIKDMGLMVDNNRLMSVTLTNLDVLVNSSINELTGTAGEINFELYTDMDEMVPSGVYYFDTNSNNQSFTFNYGDVKSLNISWNISDMNVSGGLVYVSKDATGYQFSFEFTLKSGYEVRGQFSGDASYEDIEMKK